MVPYRCLNHFTLVQILILQLMLLWVKADPINLDISPYLTSKVTKMITLLEY